jgi:hypothetical protein
MSTLSLGGLKAAPSKKAKVEKPTLPDPLGELSRAVSSGIAAKEHVESHTCILDQSKVLLCSTALDHLFKSAHGQANPEDSFQALAANGKATVSVKNAYKMPEDLAPVKALLGEHSVTYLVPSMTITIDASAIPAAAQQFVVNELVKLARVADDLLLGVEGDGPVFNAISVKQTTAVDKAFHADRHRLFNPAENMMIHQVLPCITSVRFDT